MRRLIRTAGHIVITNPDMLHSGILPHHTKWHSLFEKLRYVVIDEMHGYRGVFGSHVANVIRRLRRICAHYGSPAVFILARPRSPTRGAGRAADRGAGRSVIDENGAPRGRARSSSTTRRSSTGSSASGARRCSKRPAIATELIRRGRAHDRLRPRPRVTAEVLLTYLREALPPKLGAPDAVRGYRGGYLPRQRREIERGLRDGSVAGSSRTNALELGVDIGALDACVMTGYPGTIASTWQQAGRAGRREGVSLAVLVASSAPLDQFIVAASGLLLRAAAGERADQPGQPADPGRTT